MNTETRIARAVERCALEVLAAHGASCGACERRFSRSSGIEVRSTRINGQVFHTVICKRCSERDPKDLSRDLWRNFGDRILEVLPTNPEVNA